MSEIEGKCVRFLCVRYKIMRPIQRMSEAGRGQGRERDEGGGAGRGRIYRLSRDLRTLAKPTGFYSLQVLATYEILDAYLTLCNLQELAKITGACEHYRELRALQENCEYYGRLRKWRRNVSG